MGKLRAWMKHLLSKHIQLCLVLLLASFGCSKRQTRVEVGNREQTMHIANGGEPADLDPHTGRGEPEHNIMMALFEGLVSGNPKTWEPEAGGAAERWDISDDGKVYTFHLRRNGKWSNGDPLTAHDFIKSYQRHLTKSLSSEYSYMLFPVKNAEDYLNGKIQDFSQVGFRAVDDYTLEVTLHSPIPYFLSLIIHNSWFPVHMPTLLKHGAVDDRRNRWTMPENMVCNGPFILKEWKVASHIVVAKNTNYWGADDVKLNEIYFYPTESADTEERMFRAGQVHTIKECPQAKVRIYQKEKPHLINNYPILTTYFYRFNVKKPPLNDKRVRKALAMAIDREALVENVTRGGQLPAYNLTPPDTAGFNARAKLTKDIEGARRLLAEAGFPDGKNFPEMEILFNTLESHRAIAEAIQQMWKKNLNINATLRNEEWKVYLDSTTRMDYFVCRAGWGGDYIDPNTFLDLFVTDGGNNNTGWSNAEYDRIIREAGTLGEKEKRYELFQQAEVILADEVPVMPIYFYTRPRLIRPSVKGYYGNLLDQHSFQGVYLDPSAEKNAEKN